MRRIWLLAGIGAVIGGVVFMAFAYSEALPTPLQQYAPAIRQAAEKSFDGLKTLTARGQDASPAVLGIQSETSKIFQEDKAGKPLHEKAMEFTQYQYCKIIVKDYEAQQEQNSSKSPTPPQEESKEE
jgi:hypothetical protein